MMPGLNCLGAGLAAPVASGGKEYWRVFVTDNWGAASHIQIAEIEFLDSGGTIIPATGGTAIGSDDSTGGEYAKAFDGNTATAWLADSGAANQWVGYNFGATKLVEGVRIKSLASGTDFLTRQPKTCKLEHSTDGVTWTTHISFHNSNLAGASQVYPITAGAGFHKYWRLFAVDQNGAASNTAIDDLQWRATAGGADQSTVLSSNNGDSTCRSISVDSFYSDFQVHDSDLSGSFTSHLSGTTNMWWGTVFAVPIKVEEILVKCGTTSTQRARAPKNMRVEYSDDAVTWTSQKTIAAQTGWTSNQSRVLAAI